MRFQEYELKILLDNPSKEIVDDFFEKGVAGIDSILAMFPEGFEKEGAVIILEYRNNQLSIGYVVRNDGVPVDFINKR